MTENEFEKRFMAEMSEQQNTAVKAVQGAVLLLAVPGSGKTTVTRLINGLIPHYYEGKMSGGVWVNGAEVSNLYQSRYA